MTHLGDAALPSVWAGLSVAAQIRLLKWFYLQLVSFLMSVKGKYYCIPCVELSYCCFSFLVVSGNPWCLWPTFIFFPISCWYWWAAVAAQLHGIALWDCPLVFFGFYFCQTLKWEESSVNKGCFEGIRYNLNESCDVEKGAQCTLQKLQPASVRFT